MLAENEPIPDRPGMRGLLETCAKRWQQPGETLWWIGHLWITNDDGLPPDVREGDDLLVRREEESPFAIGFYWQGVRLGVDWARHHDMLERIRQWLPFRVRVVRLDHSANDFRGRVAYAVYGLPRLVQGSSAP